MFAFHRQHRSFAWCQRKLIRKLIIMDTDCAWYVRFLLFELTLFLRFFWAFRGKCWCSLYTVRWYNAWPSGACIWKIWAGEFFYFQVWGKLTKTRLRLERHTLFRQHAVFIILKCELLAKDAMGELWDRFHISYQSIRKNKTLEWILLLNFVLLDEV